MSQKIDDVLHVLKGIRREFRTSNLENVRRIRMNVVNEIARERHVTPETIRDAYRRRLEPDVKGTGAFDRLVEDWLLKNSNSLRKILEEHALDEDDPIHIQEFFFDR
jgi:hypothetical protein